MHIDTINTECHFNNISIKSCIYVPEVCFFILSNSADPDEMLPYAAFHLGLHCLPKYQYIGIQNEKV